MVFLNTHVQHIQMIQVQRNYYSFDYMKPEMKMKTK